MSLLRKATLSLVGAFTCIVQATSERSSTEVRAKAAIRGNEISGDLEFVQETYTANTRISGVISGLYPDKSHGVQIHEGSLANAGPIFNPFGKQHGGPWQAERKVGDIGNVKADSQGVGNFTIDDPFVKLSGPFSVLGKILSVHENPDDLGLGRNDDSKITGGVGKPIASGAIIKQ